MEMSTSERERIAKAKAESSKRFAVTPQLPEYAYRVPEVDISGLTGLLENMLTYETDGQINLPKLAESLHLDANNLFQLTEVLDMLRFVKITGGETTLTEAGRYFAEADILKRKQLFAEHLLKYIPLAQHIRNALDRANNHNIVEDEILDELENYFSEDESERILRTIIDWGRYAEIFAYDYDSGELSLENPQ
jgi:NitT/TauT family transport system ATP-binding protein